MTMPTRSSRLATLLGGTVLAAGLPGLVAAQTSGDAMDLGEITYSVIGADAVGERANPFTLTGVKTATRITDVPQSVSVVSRAEVEETNAAKIDEALQTTAGVQAAPFGYDSDMNWIYSRGFDATQTGVFMDGLQLYSYGFGSYYIDPFLVERVETLRGPSSMLYGSSNPGGVVNYVSRLPDGDEGSVAEIGADTEGRSWVSAETGGTTGDGLAYRFGSKLQRIDGHGAFDDGLEGTVFGGITKAFDDGGKLTLNLSYTGADEDHAGGTWLPYEGTVVDASFGTFDEYFNTGEPGYDDYERDQVLTTAIYQRDVGGWALTSTLRGGWADIAEEQVYAYGYDTSGDLARTYFAHESEAASLHSDTNVTRTVELGGAEHEMLFGLNLKRYHLDQTQSAPAFPDAATPLSPSDPEYGAAQPSLSPYIDEELTQTQAGVYAQDQIRWGEGWIATLNGRYDIAETDVDNALGDDLDRTDDAFSWRLGLAREIGSVTPYVTAGTYFNPQVLSAPAQADFEPETGQQIEAGVKWAPNDYSLVTFAAFETTRENISQDEWSPGEGTTYYQIGEVRSRGVELEAKAELSPEWRLRGSLTHLDVEVMEDADPVRVGHTPTVVIEDMAALSVSYSPDTLQGLTLRGGARYYGPSWADDANTLEVPEVTLFDAGARYDFEGGWSANLDVSNLADEDYVSACNSPTECYQGEGRNVSLAISKSF